MKLTVWISSSFIDGALGSYLVAVVAPKRSQERYLLVISRYRLKSCPGCECSPLVVEFQSNWLRNLLTSIESLKLACLGEEVGNVVWTNLEEAGS